MVNRDCMLAREGLVLLDGDRRIAERRPAQVRGVRHAARQRDAQIARRHAPRRAVVFVGEAATRGEHASQRRREPFRPRRFRVPGELRKVVTSVGEGGARRPRLDEHVPVGHLDRRDGQLPREDGPPREHHLDPPGLEERAVAGLQPFDHDVVEDEDAGRELHRQPADVQRPVHVVRAFAFRAGLQLRTQVHREERHEHAGDNGDEKRQQPQRGAPPARPPGRRRTGRRRLRLGRSLDGRGGLFRQTQHFVIRSQSEHAPPRPTCPASPRRP